MNPVIQALGRRLRLGVIGGGAGSFIGPVHRTAARLDDNFRDRRRRPLLRPRARPAATAAAIGLADRARLCRRPRRCSRRERAAAPTGSTSVAIMTPNDSHFRAAHGGRSSRPRRDLRQAADDQPRRCARPRTPVSGAGLRLLPRPSTTPPIRWSGRRGRWSATATSARSGMVQVTTCRATTRTPGRGRAAAAQPGTSTRRRRGLAGPGRHRQPRAPSGAYVTGLELAGRLADVGATVPGRTPTTMPHPAPRWTNGAPGTMWVTQAAAGAEHGLAFRIFGSQRRARVAPGAAEPAAPPPARRLEQVLTQRLHGRSSPTRSARPASSIGHPEGYQEAFATLYRDAAEAIVARRTGQQRGPAGARLPDRRGRRARHAVHRGRRRERPDGALGRLPAGAVRPCRTLSACPAAAAAAPAGEPVVEAVEAEELVRRVEVLVRRREREEHRVEPEHGAGTARRSAPWRPCARAAAGGRRARSSTALGGRERRVVAGDGVGARRRGPPTATSSRAAARAVAPADARRRGAISRRVLVRHEPAGDLRVRLARDHRLLPGPW